MGKFPKKLALKLEARKANSAYRVLPSRVEGVDFSSNDYLGFSKNTNEILVTSTGATGSRLLTGNHSGYQELEKNLTLWHQTDAALVFNSGYAANLGFFSCVPQRGDVVFYDQFIHASIRDGLTMGNAKAIKFRHNDFTDLEKAVHRFKANHSSDSSIYVVTESVFSMDGDSPNLPELVVLCEKNNCCLVVDEAHAVGILGEDGMGLVQQLNLQHRIFARVVTFGKALGTHGAAILGSSQLKAFLVNFARSLIYTTALAPQTILDIQLAYQLLLQKNKHEQKQLTENIRFFREELKKCNLEVFFVNSQSAIQSIVIPGNARVHGIAEELQQAGFDIKPIVSPTVEKGKERLRFCLHSYNTKKEMEAVLRRLTVLLAL